MAKVNDKFGKKSEKEKSGHTCSMSRKIVAVCTFNEIVLF